MVLLFAALALWVLQTPLQRFISLGRYQHYGIAISVFGLGYLAQTIFSWRRLKAWGIAAYTSTGIFFSSVGLVFYLNPWLDYKIAVQTPEDERTRSILILSYLIFSAMLAFIWIRWVLSENNPRNRTSKSESQIE